MHTEGSHFQNNKGVICEQLGGQKLKKISMMCQNRFNLHNENTIYECGSRFAAKHN